MCPSPAEQYIIFASSVSIFGFSSLTLTDDLFLLATVSSLSLTDMYVGVLTIRVFTPSPSCPSLASPHP